MIEIVDNLWRPYIKLTSFCYDWAAEDGVEQGKQEVPYYFDITSKCSLKGSEEGGTCIYILHGPCIEVKETPEEIIEACDNLIKQEQEKKAEEAKKYFEETQARVAATAAAMGDK